MPFAQTISFRQSLPQPEDEHWVLDGALLAPLLPDRLAQIVGGSLNNKIFPNKKELQRWLLTPFTSGPNRIPSHALMIGGSFTSLPPSWLITPGVLLPILPPPVPANSRNNLRIVFFTMKTNVLLHCEFFALANTLSASARPFWIQPFLRGLMNPQRILSKLPFNI